MKWIVFFSLFIGQIGFIAQAYAFRIPQAAWIAMSPQNVLSALGIEKWETTDQLRLEVPKIIENGQSIPIKIISDIPKTTHMCLMMVDNPFPLVACFEFKENVASSIATRLRGAQSTRLVVLVKAGGQYYRASQPIQIGIGGCGPVSSFGEESKKRSSPSLFRIKTAGKTSTAYLRIHHLTPRPMRAADYSKTPFVRQVLINANQKTLFKATLGPSMTDHPYFAIAFKEPLKNLSAIWSDQAGRQEILKAQ